MAIATVNVYAVASGFVQQSDPHTVFPTQENTPYIISGDTSSFDGRKLYFTFDDFPAALQYNKIVGGMAHGWFKTGAGIGSPKLHRTWHPFDPETLTYANAPGGDTVLRQFTEYSTDTWEELTNPPSVSDVSNSGFASELCTMMQQSKTCYVDSSATNYGDDYYATRKMMINFPNGDPFYITFYYDDEVVAESQVSRSSGPNGGYSDPRFTTVFSWQIKKSSSFPTIATNFDQASATFRWKAYGSETWTEIPISGSTNSITIPANTFPTATTISWYVEATDVSGHTSETSVFSFSTADGTAYASPVSPINEAKDGSSPILFSWELSSDSGYSPSRVLLEWLDTENDTWTTLLDASPAVSSFSAPADTFPPGSIQWRVSAYNRDGTQGPTSEASFVCLAAPATPTNMEVTAVPFAAISWQATGQQAFEIFVDGTGLGATFGTDKSYTLDEPLSDGEHIIAVSVQGEFGLWSRHAEQAVTIQNVPGQSVTLSGLFDVDADLSWTTTDTNQNYYVYRDGVRIGHTSGTVFLDRFVLGTFAWHVINRLPNGNYTRSNTLTGTTSTEITRIAALDGSGWLDLYLTDREPAEQTFRYEKIHSLRHVAGTNLPVLELSPYENISVSLDTAFKTPNLARPFEALKGRIVILKMRDDNVIVGALTSISKTARNFYISYGFTIDRIAMEDYIDDFQDS